MSKRAIRRHHRERMIARARGVQQKWWGGLVIDQDQLADAARKLADNIASCSCRGCCNVRRARGWQGPSSTIQERRSALALKDHAEENE